MERHRFGLPRGRGPHAARAQDWSAGDHASWAIAAPDTRALLGSLSLHKIDRGQGTAEIGYWTVPAARGRGAATYAVDAGCRWTFVHTPMLRENP